MRFSLGLDVQALEYFCGFIVAVFLFSTPLTVSLFFRVSSVNKLSAAYFTLTVAIVLTLLHVTIIKILILSLGSVGFVLSLQYLAKESWRTSSSLIVLSAVSAGISFLFSNTYVSQAGISAPIFSDVFALSGLLHGDDYFHTSIISIFKHWDSISTGLDGLVHLKSHTFVHIWISALSLVLGSDSLTALAIARTVIFPTLSLFATCLLVRVVSLNSIVPSATACVITTCVLSGLFDIAFGHDWYAFRNGHTFGLAGPLALFGCVYLNELSSKNFVLPALFGLLFTTILTLSKPHVGVWFMVALISMCIAHSSGTMRSRFFIICIPLLALLVFLLQSTINVSYLMSSYQRQPGIFTIVFPRIMICYFVIIAAVFLRLKLYRSLWPDNQKLSDAMNLTWPILILVNTTLVALCVLLLTNDTTANSHYFLFPSTLVALSLSSADLGIALRSKLIRVASPSLSIVLLLFCGLCVAVLSKSLFSAIDTFTDLRSIVSKPEIKYKANSGKIFIDTVKHMASENGTPSLIYISPAAISVWNHVINCDARPFFVPSLTGIPLLLGLPEKSPSCPNALTTGYGFDDYASTSYSRIATNETL
jgi:hypothetical protein